MKTCVAFILLFFVQHLQAANVYSESESYNDFEVNSNNINTVTFKKNNGFNLGASESYIIGDNGNHQFQIFQGSADLLGSQPGLAIIPPSHITALGFEYGSDTSKYNIGITDSVDITFYFSDKTILKQSRYLMYNDHFYIGITSDKEILRVIISNSSGIAYPYIIIDNVSFGTAQVPMTPPSAPSVPDTINCLFNWAENNYKNLFSPAASPAAFFPPYIYKYYSSTDAYLGFSSADNHTYYMSGSDNILHDEGLTSYWLSQANCQQPSCQLPNPSTKTQTQACPSVQTGTITQTSTATCPSPTGNPVWGAWVTSSNTCGISCQLPNPATRTQTQVCPSGQTGTITQTSTATCPSPTGNPVWSDWVSSSNTCRTQETLQQAAAKAGISLSQKMPIGHYTDLLTLPQTKTECTHQHEVTPAIVLCNAWNTDIFSGHFGECTNTYVAASATYACDTWASYKKVMNCDWYINMPLGTNTIISETKDAVQSVINDAINFAKSAIVTAVTSSLADSAVAAIAAGFASEGIGAGPTFLATLEATMPTYLGTAQASIVTYLKTVPTVQLEQIIMPKLTTDQITESCGWSDWQRI